MFLSSVLFQKIIVFSGEVHFRVVYGGIPWTGISVLSTSLFADHLLSVKMVGTYQPWKLFLYRFLVYVFAESIIIIFAQLVFEPIRGHSL